MCEDYPCCGHTDGLGCDWVSPNEIVPCQTCIDARQTSPYHSASQGCKTQRAQAISAVPANMPCEYFEDGEGCDGEQADIVEEGTYLCFTCLEERNAFMREMQEQYDEYGNRF